MKSAGEQEMRRAALFLAGLGVVALGVRLVPVVTQGQVRDFFEAQERYFPTALNEPGPPFRIDLTATSACPDLTTNAAARYYSKVENTGLHGKVENVPRIHLLEDGYHLYVFEAGSGRCISETVFATLNEARRASQRYITGVENWTRIPHNADWTRVPLFPPGEG